MLRIRKTRIQIHTGRGRGGTIALAIGLVFAVWAGSASLAWGADGRSKAGVQSLDQQVQDIKSDVLAIAAELRTLEEQLLHPSSTQVSVFVEIGPEQDVQIDAARILIDGEPVAHHVYTHPELVALQNGGIQRVYTGNLREGEHTLRVEIEGRRRTGRFESSQESLFRKDVGPKKVGVTLSDALTGGAQVAIQDW